MLQPAPRQGPPAEIRRAGALPEENLQLALTHLEDDG
jgi:hypothetical protein